MFYQQKGRSVKRKSYLNLIRAIKNSSFNEHFLYTDIHAWSKPFQNIFGDDFLFPAQNVFSSSVQLYPVSHGIFTISVTIALL